MHAPNKVLASCLMLSMAGGLILPQAAEASSVQDLQNKKAIWKRILKPQRLIAIKLPEINAAMHRP